MAAPTITSTLETIWASEGEPILIAALSTFAPWIATIFNIPILGPILVFIMNKYMNKLIAAGVIDIKVGIINFLSKQAQITWAAEISILKQVEAAGKVLDDEQRAAYDAALQALGANHGGIVNS